MTQSHQNAQPHEAMVKIHTLRDKTNRIVPLSRLATRHSWNGMGCRADGTPYYRADWVTLFAKPPGDLNEAIDLSEAHRLWFVLDGGKFMTPCLIREMIKTQPQAPVKQPEGSKETHFLQTKTPQDDTRVAPEDKTPKKATSGPNTTQDDVDDLWDFM